MLRCGVVGYGYWGVNVARTIESLECAELYALCEIESTRAKEALGAFPHLRIYEDFEEFLGDVSNLTLPPKAKERENVYHLYVVRVGEKRDEIIRGMQAMDVEVGIHYPIALPALEASWDIEAQKKCPNAMAFSKEILSLPMGEHLSKEDVREVSHKLRSLL